MLWQQQFLRLNFSRKFLQKLAQVMQEGKCNPEETLANEGSGGADRLIFVHKGSLEQVIELQDKKRVVRAFKKGELLGRYSFFARNYRGEQFVSTSIVWFSFVTFEQFQALLAQFPADFESFCQIRDEMNLLGSNTRLLTACALCEQNESHPEARCPLVNLSLNRDRLIAVARLTAD